MKHFWDTLPKPFTILAPMEGVTDTVFRQIVTDIGRADVFFTEFVSTDGIMSKGRDRVGQSLLFDPKEQPVVAQIWGNNPKLFYEAAKYVATLGFSGIDINMGCPVRKVVGRGSCSGLIRNPNLAAEIIQATKEGAGELPVSVKTRLGFKVEEYEKWLGFILEQDIVNLSVHLRTVPEMSKVPAHWELMPDIIALRDQIAPKTLIVDHTIVWWAFMIGYISHLFMDTITRDGVPWLFPIPIHIGIPPFKALRMKTGGMLEKSVVFPILMLCNGYLFYTYHKTILDFIHNYIK